MVWFCCISLESKSSTYWLLRLTRLKRETLAQVFSCAVCEISKTTFFTEHHRNIKIKNMIIWFVFTVNRKNMWATPYFEISSPLISLVIFFSMFPNKLCIAGISNSKQHPVCTWSTFLFLFLSTKMLTMVFFLIKRNAIDICRSSHRRCSAKIGVLKNLSKFTESTCARVSFLIKLQASGLQLYWKRFWLRCFPMNFEKFLRTPFLQNTSGGCFCIWH